MLQSHHITIYNHYYWYYNQPVIMFDVPRIQISVTLHPASTCQEKCIKAVLRECKLTPTEVECIECHGTGTSGCLGHPGGKDSSGKSVGQARDLLMATYQFFLVFVNS